MLKISQFTLALFLFSLPVSMAGMEIFSWLGFFLFIFYSGYKKIKFGVFPGIKTDLFVPLMILFTVVALSLFFNTTLDGAKKWLILGEIRWILLFFSFVYLFTISQEKVKKIYWTYLSILAITGLYALLQAFTGVDLIRHPDTPILFNWNQNYRPNGFFSNTMTFSYVFAMNFFIVLPSALLKLYENNRQKILTFFCLFIISIDLILTLTRGAWLAASISLIIFCFLYNYRLIYKFALPVLISTFLALQLLPSTKSRVDSITSTTHQSNSQRINIWRANWEMFKDSPIVGVGYIQNNSLLETYYQRLGIQETLIGHAHNNYLEILGGTGILGLLAFLYFFSYSLLISIKNAFLSPLTNPWHRMLALSTFGAQLCFHLGGLTEAVLVDGEVFHLFIFLVAINMALHHLYNNAPLRWRDVKQALSLKFYLVRD